LVANIVFGLVQVVSAGYAFVKTADFRTDVTWDITSLPRLPGLEFLSWVTIASGVVWLVWTHGCQRVLTRLAAPVRFTPGWAVGWWFVPFANLVKPYQVMREQSEAGPSPPAVSRRLRRMWWTTYLLSIAIGLFNVFLLLKAYSFVVTTTPAAPRPFVILIDDLGAWRRTQVGLIVGYAFYLFSAYLAIRLTRGVTERTATMLEGAIPSRPDRVSA
jgi:Domain of unknown function (DUF4328)